MLRKAKRFNDSNRTFRLTQYVLQNTVPVAPTFFAAQLEPENFPRPAVH
jgi:hypothetical protein